MEGLGPDFIVDFARLRQARLRKLQKEMAARGIGACVLTNPVNIRYATDVSVMPIWTALNLARFAVVPVEGDPVLFEYGKALFRATALWPRSKPVRSWQLRFSQSQVEDSSRHFASEVDSLMKEWGVGDSAVATDVLDCHGFSALQKLGRPIVDADGPLGAAHKIKTADEIWCLRNSCSVAETALFEMERAIRPGVSENELLGTFWGKMQSLGGEHCSTRLIVSGEKTNPWFYEAGERRVRPGDLVGIDTDMVGPHGYLCDISRTFLCGDTANADQIEAYQVAYDFIQGTIELCRPGASYRSIVERAPKYPAEYAEQGYSCMIHGDGMDDEPPFLPFPHDLPKAVLPEGQLEAGMVLSVEFYAGKKGKRDGVKLEEQILVTPEGPALLSSYPFEEKLLGRRP
jgi:Xaa-Pro aminopeptidase